MKFVKKVLALIVAMCLTIGMTVSALSRDTDITSSSDGSVLVALDGKFSSEGKDAMLQRINEIRLEACEQGVLNPNTGEALTVDDYVPIKWSSDLEWIAQTRAAEATVCQSHTRPNGTLCFSLAHNGVGSYAEDLAWNWSGMAQGVEQWYDEKQYWVDQDTSQVTGHYTSLINPKYTYIGLGTFRLNTGGWYATAGELSSASSLDESEIGVQGSYSQTIEFSESDVSISLPSSDTIEKGSSKSLTLSATVTQADYYGSIDTYDGVVNDGSVVFSSSDPDIVSVDEQGNITANEYGTATITASVGSLTAQCEVVVCNVVKEVSVSADSVTLKRSSKNVSKTIDVAIVSPTENCDNVFTVESSDTAVVKVSNVSSGFFKLTSVGKGSATVAIKNSIGTTVKSIKVTVKQLVTNLKGKTVKVQSSKKTTLKLSKYYTISPGSASNKSVKVTIPSKAKKFMKLSGNKLTIKKNAKKGTYKLKVTAKDGSKKYCNVKIKVK